VTVPGVLITYIGEEWPQDEIALVMSFYVSGTAQGGLTGRICAGYLGGTAAGVVPGIFWAIGKWPACVGFIVSMQLAALAVVLVGWRSLQSSSCTPLSALTKEPEFPAPLR
jgi:hypothetical protein